MTIVRHETNARMSQAVVHGGTVYLAGQVAAEPAGNVAGQTTAILKQVDRLLALSGSSPDRVLSATIYLTDMKSFSEMNKAWEAWVAPGSAPARATVEAKLAGPQYLVEISIVAAAGK